MKGCYEQKLFLWGLAGGALGGAFWIDLAFGEVWMCVRAGADYLLWLSIGAVVSLHFFTLGKLSHVRTYNVTAISGTILSGAGFAVSATAFGVATIGVCLAAVIWGTSCSLYSMPMELLIRHAQDSGPYNIFLNTT